MLTDTAVRNAKPRDKAYKRTDGAGLYLFVNQTEPNTGGLTTDSEESAARYRLASIRL